MDEILPSSVGVPNIAKPWIFKTFERDVKDNHGPNGIHIRKQAQVQTSFLFVLFWINSYPFFGRDFFIKHLIFLCVYPFIFNPARNSAPNYHDFASWLKPCEDARLYVLCMSLAIHLRIPPPFGQIPPLLDPLLVYMQGCLVTPRIGVVINQKYTDIQLTP